MRQYINIKQLCSTKGCRLEDVASFCGCSANTIRRLQNDIKGLRFETMNKLCEFFETSSDNLIQEENDG